MIEKAIFWNIRYVNTQNAFGRLMDLNRRHRYLFIALMESFQDLLELDQFRIMLGFDRALVNRSGKIWIIWKEDWEGTVVLDSFQPITMRFSKNNHHYIISSVYARCSAIDKLELWEELEEIAEIIQVPWIVGGDFNVSLCADEKLGGLAFTQHEAIDFAQCINNCALS